MIGVNGNHQVRRASLQPTQTAHTTVECNIPFFFKTWQHRGGILLFNYLVFQNTMPQESVVIMRVRIVLQSILRNLKYFGLFRQCSPRPNCNFRQCRSLPQTRRNSYYRYTSYQEIRSASRAVSKSRSCYDFRRKSI